LIQFFLDEEARQEILNSNFHTFTRQQFKTLDKILNALPTWDKVHLVGSKVLHGDVIEFWNGGRKFPKAVLKNQRTIQFHWSRSALKTGFKFMVGSNLGFLKLHRQRIDLSPNDTLLFHEAGQPKPSRVPAGEIVRVEFG